MLSASVKSITCQYETTGESGQSQMTKLIEDLDEHILEIEPQWMWYHSRLYGFDTTVDYLENKIRPKIQRT